VPKCSHLAQQWRHVEGGFRMEVGREDDRQHMIARTYLLNQGVPEKLKEGMLKTKEDASSSCDGGRLGTKVGTCNNLRADHSMKMTEGQYKTASLPFIF
jgi:hypothetical protein